MRKSSAILSAVALGLAMFVPLKASAQGVTIYINPGYPGYAPGYSGYGRLIPAMAMGAIRLMVTPIQATAMATVIADPTTAPIGAITDA